MATKACELTKYKKPTSSARSAAAYAEAGDFETAKKWSKKAVDMGGKKKEVDEQLKTGTAELRAEEALARAAGASEKEEPVQPPRSQFEA